MRLSQCDLGVALELAARVEPQQSVMSARRGRRRVGAAPAASKAKAVRSRTSASDASGCHDCKANRPWRFTNTAIGVTTPWKPPHEVRKSSLSTSVRRECSVRQVQARFAVGSITAPPPPPGRRTLG